VAKSIPQHYLYFNLISYSFWGIHQPFEGQLSVDVNLENLPISQVWHSKDQRYLYQVHTKSRSIWSKR